MFTKRMLAASAVALVTLSVPATAGGSPSGNIVAAAAASPDFETLVAAVKAAKLVDTLASKGPFTVFAPTDAAFAKIDSATLQNLLKPENRDQLAKVLTYHVVPGRTSAAALMAKIQADGGKTMLKTVQGENLTAAVRDGAVWLTDAKGGMSKVTIADVNQSNGVIHVVDTVLMP